MDWKEWPTFDFYKWMNKIDKNSVCEIVLGDQTIKLDVNTMHAENDQYYISKITTKQECVEYTNIKGEFKLLTLLLDNVPQVEYHFGDLVNLDIGDALS